MPRKNQTFQAGHYTSKKFFISLASEIRLFGKKLSAAQNWELSKMYESEALESKGMKNDIYPPFLLQSRLCHGLSCIQ